MRDTEAEACANLFSSARMEGQCISRYFEAANNTARLRLGFNFEKLINPQFDVKKSYTISDRHYKEEYSSGPFKKIMVGAWAGLGAEYKSSSKVKMFVEGRFEFMDG